MSKRANGEGSIKKRKDGRWIASIQVGIKADGKPRMQYIYGKTQGEVVQKRNEAQLNLGLGVDVANGNVTVNDWCFEWLNKYKQKLALSTKTSYETNIRVHINQYIGGVKINKLTRGQIQYMLDDIFNEGETSVSLYIKIFNVLNGAMKQAVRLGMVRENPCNGIPFPAEEEIEMRFFTPEEQIKFEEALDDEDSRALMMSYAYCGARLGELLPLIWKDVSFESRQLYIRKKAIVIYDHNSTEKKTKNLVENNCKTKSSKRGITITPFLVEILKEHMEKQQNLYKLLGRQWSENELVFPTSNFTVPYGRNVQEKFERIVTKAKLEPATIHCLRHTYVSRCFEAGISIEVISKQLGHKSVKTTQDIYLHIIPAKKQEEMDKLEKLDTLRSNIIKRAVE